MNTNAHWLLVGLGLTATGTVDAHHSAVMFDTSREIVIEGIVREYDWRNPHVHMVIATTGADGQAFEQRIEVGAPSVLLPLGLTANALTIGERVTVHANPNRNGDSRPALGRYLTRETGEELPLNIAARAIRTARDAQATSLAGTWFSPLGQFRDLGSARSAWKVTEKGRLAMADWDISRASYADCIPVTAPTLMVYPVTMTVEVGADKVVFNVDWMTSQRIVYLDGRTHPDSGARELHGHSIGHWEGKTLVVDTTRYADHTEGLAVGLASGAGKHTVERFSLADDGRHMNYEIVLEDPEYLAEPITYRAQLDYRPDLQPTGLACDLEAARRYKTDG